MDGLAVATKSMRTLADFEDYIAAFNADDFPGYCAYYAKDVFMNIGSLSEKTLQGYLEWIKPMRVGVSETLNPQRVAFDRDGSCVVARVHTKFRGREGFRTDNFAGKWGPVYPGEGPLVLMTVWYMLDKEGHIIELAADSSLMEKATAEA
ncbi:putative hydrolase family protein [Neofusicoccum parvum]|uniref:Hydrolase family protein n=1 Tax=Neofusicoccum parvum TaxID=310453 RepID=A0ACB5S795_9PEZI|nr:putative hydrolase family protein [Neofusicoccum parvum]